LLGFTIVLPNLPSLYMLLRIDLIAIAQIL
jgi:hypothetical protein